MLAEMGIVLLLFTVGLEFSLTEIRRIWRKVLIGGTIQIALTALVILVLGKLIAVLTQLPAWRPTASTASTARHHVPRLPAPARRPAFHR